MTAEVPTASEQRAAEGCSHGRYRDFRDGDGGHRKCLDCGRLLIANLAGLMDDERLGARDAVCGCCVIVDKTGLLDILADRAAAEDHGLLARVVALAKDEERLALVLHGTDHAHLHTSFARQLRAAIGDDGRGGTP